MDVREAYRKAPDRDRLLAALKREGIDTAFVERLGLDSKPGPQFFQQHLDHIIFGESASSGGCSP